MAKNVYYTGWMDACAGPLLRYRRQIGGEHVAIFCDIKKKHSAHAVTQDVDIAETARAAQFFRADGVIVTGEERTGTDTNTVRYYRTLHTYFLMSPRLPQLRILVRTTGEWSSWARAEFAITFLLALNGCSSHKSCN
jgi:hypothetical protein